MASKVEWDKQGRMSLSEKTLTRTGIGRDVTVIGARDHLEIWDRSDWEARFRELKTTKDKGAMKPRPGGAPEQNSK
jgi:DNA-binding transcriptional regulator/RsmH inhibitor MraZ